MYNETDLVAVISNTPKQTDLHGGGWVFNVMVINDDDSISKFPVFASNKVLEKARMTQFERGTKIKANGRIIGKFSNTLLLNYIGHAPKKLKYKSIIRIIGEVSEVHGGPKRDTIVIKQEKPNLEGEIKTNFFKVYAEKGLLPDLANANVGDMLVIGGEGRTYPSPKNSDETVIIVKATMCNKTELGKEQLEYIIKNTHNTLPFRSK